MTQMHEPPQGGYHPPPPQGPPTNTLAIIALVCAFVFAPAGLVCGIIARKQIRQSGEAGAGLALAGIIISALQIVLAILFLIFFIIFFVVLADTANEIVDNLPTPSPFPTA